MDYTRYRIIAERLIDQHEGGNTSRKWMTELVGVIRSARGKKSNLQLYYDLYPFALEARTKNFPQYDTEGANFVKDALKEMKRGYAHDVIPMFLAWLWYRHEYEARQFHDDRNLQPTPYIGHPSIEDCPSYVRQTFNFREEESDKYETLNEPVPYDFENYKKGSIFYKIGSFAKEYFFTAIIVIALLLGMKFWNSGLASDILRPLKDVSNTWCVFFEKDILEGKNSISGILQRERKGKSIFSRRTSAPLEMEAGSYAYLTGDVIVYKPVSEDFNKSEEWLTMEPTLDGEPITFERSSDSVVSGHSGGHLIFKIELDRHTGIYEYTQYEPVDQPFSGSAGNMFYMLFEFHLHEESGNLSSESQIAILVMDERHDPDNRATLNGQRQ